MAYEPGSLYFYKPSLSAPIVCIIVFFLLALGHTFLTYRFRSWRFTLPIIICALEITAGLAFRAVGSSHFTDLGIFVAQLVLTQVAPPIFTLALYLTLARALYYVPWLSPIDPGRVRTTLIGLDAILGALLGTGAARISNTQLSAEQREVGASLVKGGMVLQCILVGNFILLCAVFYHRCRKRGVVKKIERVMLCLFACSGCILLRTIFRTIEIFQGSISETTTHEAYFYCLDILWVILAMIIFLVWFPAKQLPQTHKTYLAPDGETEKEGPGWNDQRHRIVTLFDPFDLTGLIWKKQRSARFWEMETDNASAEDLGVTSDRPKPHSAGFA